MLILMIMITYFFAKGQRNVCTKQVISLEGTYSLGLGILMCERGGHTLLLYGLEPQSGDSRSKVMRGLCLSCEDRRPKVNLPWSFRTHEVHTEWGWKLVHPQRIWNQRRSCKMEGLEAEFVLWWESPTMADGGILVTGGFDVIFLVTP